MTITYDPHDPAYLDEADVRNELTRVYDLCHGCRLCFKFCTAFPSLFEMIDRHDDQDVGRLTPAQQDRVVDECFQCKLCYINCPYVPGQHEWAIDFPRLMLRADAMLHETGQVSVRDKVTTQTMGRTDLLGTVGSRTAPLMNRALGAKPGGLVRKLLEKTSGVSSVRLLPPFALWQRFSSWFKRRPTVRIGKRQGTVALFPTCLVEYQQPEIGHDLVKVYERNGIEVSLSDIGCCGAPWLHSGDRDHFVKVAAKNVKALAAEVAQGRDIVVPQPTCSYILKKDYPDYVPGADAETVAAHTFDAAEYLMKVHRGDGTSLDTTFEGDVPETITYHTPCHLRAQNIGLKSRDLMKLTGSKIKLVQQCSGIDGMWGLRAENAGISVPIAGKLGDEIVRADGAVVAGDCHLANTAITEQTGRVPLHPLQVVARAYGIDPEGDRAVSPRKLVLADISDVRQYERERDQYRTHVMELRRRRRVPLGTVMTVSFESRDTIRYQIQEMARAERLTTDEDIQVELDTYNPLIPDVGRLCATLFLELTSDEQLREWLPKLVGIERHIVLRLSDGFEVRSVPEAQHASQLTRENVTSAVHYLEFDVGADRASALSRGATLVADHPNYHEAMPLAPSTVAELVADVAG